MTWILAGLAGFALGVAATIVAAWIYALTDDE